jgi:hypothetical protein
MPRELTPEERKALTDPEALAKAAARGPFHLEDRVVSDLEIPALVFDTASFKGVQLRNVQLKGTRRHGIPPGRDRIVSVAADPPRRLPDREDVFRRRRTGRRALRRDHGPEPVVPGHAPKMRYRLTPKVEFPDFKLRKQYFGKKYGAG